MYLLSSDYLIPNYPMWRNLSTLFMDLYVLLKTNIKICNIYCKNTFNIIKSENVFNLSKVPHATFKFTDIWELWFVFYMFV